MLPAANGVPITARAELPETLERLLREVSNGYSGVLAEELRAAIREALDEAEKREAAARLAGRLEQAVESIRLYESADKRRFDPVGYRLLDWLIDARDRLRAELTAAGKEGE